MPRYRIYLTDVLGRIQSGEDMICSINEQAFTEAHRRIGPYPRAEVWEGDRRLGVVNRGLSVLDGGIDDLSDQD
jgi:hypothetical protein